MSHYESALISDRMSNLRELVRRERERAEVRRGRAAARAETPRVQPRRSGTGRGTPGIRALFGLRSTARRRLKGRRNLA